MVRVRMPYRRLKVEDSTEYIPIIYNIVKEKTKGYNTSNEDIMEVKLSEIKPIMNSILTDLAFNMFVK
jgi:hypothetical protein